MHIFAYKSGDIGFYAKFMQNERFSILFLPKNLGRELKISRTYAKISP